MRNLPLPSPHSLRDFGFFFWAARAFLPQSSGSLSVSSVYAPAWVTLNMPSEKRAFCGAAPGAESEVSSTTPLRASTVVPIGIASPAASVVHAPAGPFGQTMIVPLTGATTTSSRNVGVGVGVADGVGVAVAAGVGVGVAGCGRATTILRVARRRGVAGGVGRSHRRRRARRRRRPRASPPSSGRRRSRAALRPRARSRCCRPRRSRSTSPFRRRSARHRPGRRSRAPPARPCRS